MLLFNWLMPHLAINHIAKAILSFKDETVALEGTVRGTFSRDDGSFSYGVKIDKQAKPGDSYVVPVPF